MPATPFQEGILKVGNVVGSIYHALPQGVQGFLGSMFEPTRQAERDQAAQQQSLVSDAQAAVPKIYEKLQGALDEDGDAINPEFAKTVADLKSLSADNNTLFGQAVSKVNQNLGANWDVTKGVNNKQLADNYDQTLTKAINFAKLNLPQAQRDALLTDPLVTKYLSHKAKVTEGPQQTWAEKAGGIVGMFYSPWMASADVAQIAAGKITGSKTLQSAGKAGIGERYGDVELRDNPENYSIAHTAGSYLKGGGRWDLVPAMWMEGESMFRSAGLGKSGKTFEEAIGKSTTALSTDSKILTETKDILNTDKVLQRHVADAKFNVESATPQQTAEFLANNPKVQAQLLPKLEKRLAPDVYKSFAEPVQAAGQIRMITPQGVGEHMKSVLADYYKTSPRGMLSMAKIGAVQEAADIAGRITKSPAVSRIGGLFTQPVPTIMHMLGVNRQVVVDNTMKQYASAYGIGIDSIKALPDTDPFKQEIMKAANIIYNQQSFSQTLGITPKSTLGKIGTSFLDTAVDFAGIHAYMTGGSKLLGGKLNSLVTPVDKEGNVTIKAIADIEKEIGTKTTREEQLAVADRGIQTIADMYKNKNMSVQDSIKASTLFNQAMANITTALDTARQSFGATFGIDLEQQMYKIKDVLQGSDNIEIRQQAAAEMGKLSQMMYKAIETSVGLSNAPQFREDLQRETIRAQLSMEMLNHIRDSVGFGNAIKKSIIKGLAPSYVSWSNLILNDEFYKKYGTTVDKSIKDARNISEGFKLNNKEAAIMKTYFQQHKDGRYMIQEVDNAINSKIDAMLAGLTKLDPKAKEGLADVIRNTVHTTIFKSMFVQYNKIANVKDVIDLNSAKDINAIFKAKDLSAISTDILAYLFTGKEFPTGKKSALGETLKKLQDSQGKINNNQVFIDKLTEAAMKFPREVLGEIGKGIDTSVKQRAVALSKVADSIRAVSSMERGFKSYMDLISAGEIWNAPEQWEAVLGEGAKNIKGIMDQVYGPHAEDTTQNTLDTSLQNISQTLQEHKSADNLDMSSYADILSKSLAVTSERHGQRIEGKTQQDKGSNTIQEAVGKINEALVDTTPGLELSIKSSGKEIPINIQQSIDGMKELSTAWNDLMSTARDSYHAIKQEQGSTSTERAPLDPAELKIDAEPAQIASDIKSLIAKDTGFPPEFKAIQPKVISNTDIFKHANTATDYTTFLENMVESMGYPKELAYIIQNGTKYATLDHNIYLKYGNYKNGYDRTAITDTYKLEQDGWTADGNPAFVMTKDEAKPYPQYEQVSDGIKNIGITPKIIEINYGNRPNLDPSKSSIPNIRMKGYYDMVDKLQRANPESIFVPTTDSKTTFFTFNRGELDRQAAQQGIIFVDDPQRAYYAQLKMGGVDKKLGNDFQKLFTGTPEANEILARIGRGQQKYMTKITSPNVQDETNYGKALTLHETPGDPQDGMIFVANDALANGKRAASAIEDNANYTTSFKVQINGDGWGIKGDAHELTPARLGEQLLVPENYGKAVEYIKEHKGPDMNGSTPIQVAGFLLENGLNYVVMDSAIKDYFKEVPEQSRTKLGITPPEKAKSQNLPIQGVRYYPLKGEINFNDSVYDHGTWTNQSSQHVYGEAGDQLQKVLQRYTKINAAVPSMYIPQILKYIETSDYNGLQTLLRTKLNIFTSAGDKWGIVNVDKDGNILSLGPQLQGILKNVLDDNLFSKKLPGHIINLAGMPETINAKLRAEYPSAKDGNYIIASKSHFLGDMAQGLISNLSEVNDQVDQRWKTGDPVIIHRYPVTGPKSFVAPKVYFIEDLPPELKPYFMSNDGKPVAEIYISPELIQKQEADFDGDTTHMFPALSKQIAENGQPLADYLQTYQSQIDADKGTMAKTNKSTFQDLQKVFGPTFYEKGPVALGFVRQFAKDLTAQTSAISRGVSILNRDIFRGNTPIEKLIKIGNQGASAIQASVDGNMAGPYKSLFNSRIGKDGFNDSAFPNMKKLPEFTQKEFSKLIGKYIMQGKGGIFEYLGQISDTGKPLALLDQITQTKNSMKAMDNVLRLKAIDNLYGEGKITTQDVTNALSGIGDHPEIANEVSRLRAINNADTKVGLNEARIITHTDYNKAINNMVNDYSQLNLASILQEMGIKGELPTKKLLAANILTKGFELKGKGNIDKFMKMLNTPKTPADGEMLAITALSLNLEPVLPLVKQLYPDVVNHFNLYSQQQLQREGYVTTMNNAINQMNNDPQLTEMFKSLGNYTENKYQVGAYLLRGDTEGLKEFLNKNTRITMRQPTSRMDGAVTKLVENNNTAELKDTAQQKIIMDAVNTYMTDMVKAVQETMYTQGSSPEVENAKQNISQIYELVKNGDPDIIAQYSNPITEMRTEIAKVNPEAAKNKFLEQYIQHIYENMYPLLAKQVSDQMIGNQAVTENKAIYAQQTKTYKKNLNDFKYDAMRILGLSQSESLHSNLLGTYGSIADIIYADPQFQNQISTIMKGYIDQGKTLEEAHTLALQATATNRKDIKLDDATKQKIQDTAKSQIGTMGDTVSKMINDTTTQLHNLGNYGVDFNTDAKYFKDVVDNTMLKQSYKTNNGIDFLGSVMGSLNKVYKSTMVGMSIGRRVIERSNAMENNLLNKLVSHGPTDEASFLKKMGRDGFRLYTNRDFEHTTSFKEYNKYQTKLFDQYKAWPDAVKATWREKMDTFFGKIPEYTFGKTLPGQYLEAVKDQFFKREMFTALEKQVKFRDEQQPGFADKAKRWLLTNDINLSQQERYLKTRLLKETERIASKATKDAFYDYAANPMFVANLENYMPFSNFLFNSGKVFARSKLGATAWLTALAFCSNITKEFEHPEIDVDSESLRGYLDMNNAGLPILGALGFANLGFDLKRMLPIEAVNPQFFGYPYQKMFFPTQDADYTRLLTDKNYHWYDYALKKLSPSFSDLIAPLTSGDMGAFVRRLTYLTTGLSPSDSTVPTMLGQRYNKDYDGLLNASAYQLNQFNTYRSKNGMQTLTKQDIAGYKEFQNVLFGNSKANPQLDYLSVMSDALAYNQFIKPGSTNAEAQQLIDKGIKGLLTDTAVGLVWNNEMNLTDKVHQLQTTTIDSKGNIVPTTDQSKSIYAMAKRSGQMTDFFERLDYLAANYPILSQYNKANLDWNNPDNQPIVAAFRYKFQEEIGNQHRTDLEKDNPVEYFKQKVDAIKAGTLKTPIENPMKDIYGSDYGLTDNFKQYLGYSKGIILTDMENIKSRINTLYLLRDMQFSAIDKNPTHASYYYGQIKTLTNQIQQEKAKIPTYNPTLNDLNKIGSRASATYYDNAVQTYKNSVNSLNQWQSKYYQAKQRYLSMNVLPDKNATVKFTQENGITPQALITRYKILEQSLT